MDLETPPKILCVDDEPLILEGLTRQLRRNYQVKTAVGGEAALAVLEKESPFAVVISDMRMPGMNGAEFLKRSLKGWPDTVRMLLTGQTELDAAISAVNEGNIFRFLTKPCAPDALTSALTAAVNQYRLVTTERVLLEQTLHGSIKTLTDILALAQPTAFGRATRCKTLAGELAVRLKVPQKWSLEVAVMLVPIGCITLPTATAEKLYQGKQLSLQEWAMVDKLPTISKQLLAPIPRLDAVREILSGVSQAVGVSVAAQMRGIPPGAEILRVVLDADELESQGLPFSQILNTLRARKDRYNPDVLSALAALRCEPVKASVSAVKFSEVREGMTFIEDVLAKNGMLLVARGQEVTSGLLVRLNNFSTSLGLCEPLRVKLTQENAEAPTAKSA